MQNFEGTVLLWLLSSNAEQQYECLDLCSFRAIINDTRVFYHSDECIDTLSSIVDETVFLILGSGRSHLVDALSSFTHLHYIFLSEPHHSTYTTQVRGVFPRKEELLQQLTKDVTIVQNNYMHMCLSSNAELKGTQTSIQNLHHDRMQFKWMHGLFNILLHTSRPAENIHRDLLHECRLTYRGNESRTKVIDEFEKDYKPSKVIWWYTRDSFLFKLVNMALRTENMVIIWKFRFIIQDIYRRLKTLHEDQRKASARSQPQSFLTVYRGQHISTVELENLTSAESDLVTMNSFISTTRNPRIAAMFTGDASRRPDLKPVMFEIYIDESDPGHDQQPFADISDESYFGKAEEEVLLCIGTVMRIESVEVNESMTRVRLRTCRYDDPAWQNFKTDLLPTLYDSSNLIDEQLALFKIAATCFMMGQYQEAEQLLSILQTSADSLTSKLVETYIIAVRMRQLNFTDSDGTDRLKEELRKIEKASQSILNGGLLPDKFRTDFEHQAAMIANSLHCLHSKIMPFNILSVVQRSNEAVEGVRRFLLGCGTPSSEPSIRPLDIFSHCRSGEVKPSSQHISIADSDLIKSRMNETLTVKDPNRILQLWCMASEAAEESDYDRAIEFIQEGLSIPSNDDSHALLYKKLVQIHQKQGNWSAVIESYQEIIRMPQLAPRSSAIIEAHIACGDAYFKMNDFSQANDSYAKALDLQDQHYPHDHPLTSQIYIKIGNLRRKLGNMNAAVENYQKAISMRYSDTMSDAYRQMGSMYMGRHNYDLAHSNFIASLEIAKNQKPQSTALLVASYALLIKLENHTGHHYERDIHISELMSMNDSDETLQHFIEHHIQRVLDHINTNTTKTQM